jgi:hypothetical protein
MAAAVIVTVMLIPQTLTYARLAGLPPVVGLYAFILPLIAYTISGASRTLAVGPSDGAGEDVCFPPNCGHSSGQRLVLKADRQEATQLRPINFNVLPRNDASTTRSRNR